MGENLLNDYRVFFAGDDPERATTDRANLDVDAEHAHQPLRPSHRCPAFGRRGLLALIGG